MSQTLPPPITIESFPAKNGDCFFISHQDYHLLIDTGYEETYTNFLLPRFSALKASGKKLSRLIITHIDEDHIHGAIPFLENNGTKDESNVIPIEQVWHNSYRHLHRNEEKAEISDEGQQQLARLQTAGSSVDSNVSARQGSSLAALLLRGEYQWNTDFEGGPAMAPCIPIKIGEGITITLLSPTKEKLEKLERFWKRELKKIGFRDRFGPNDLFDDAYEFLLLKEKDSNPKLLDTPVSSSEESFETLFNTTTKEDGRASNGSSIAFVLEIGDKKLLFLGDAHPSMILTSLKSIYGEGPVQFDFIKISHHGSYYNSNLELLNFIDAPKYCISTNGIGHHPNRETLCWIVGRASTYTRTIYFNYNHFGVSFLNNDVWKRKYNYTIVFPEEGKSLNITI